MFHRWPGRVLRRPCGLCFSGSRRCETVLITAGPHARRTLIPVRYLTNRFRGGGAHGYYALARPHCGRGGGSACCWVSGPHVSPAYPGPALRRGQARSSRPEQMRRPCQSVAAGPLLNHFFFKTWPRFPTTGKSPACPRQKKIQKRQKGRRGTLETRSHGRTFLKEITLRKDQSNVIGFVPKKGRKRSGENGSSDTGWAKNLDAIRRETMFPLKAVGFGLTETQNAVTIHSTPPCEVGEVRNHGKWGGSRRRVLDQILQPCGQLRSLGQEIKNTVDSKMAFAVVVPIPRGYIFFLPAHRF